MVDSGEIVPQWTLQYDFRIVTKSLVILDDVWSLRDLLQLIPQMPGCKTLVVSRFKFPSEFINWTYELQLLKENEALSLFCRSAFGQNYVPAGANHKLIKQVRL